MNPAATATTIVFFAFAVMSAIGVPCQPGDVEDSTRSRCFLVFSDVMANWTDALGICRRLGATLAKMDEEDYKFLVNGHISLSKYYWFGMNDLQVENSFKWTDGTPVTWTKWRFDQPNDEGGQDCVCLDDKQEWQDKACSNNYYFICERVETLKLTYVRYGSRSSRTSLKQTTESCLMDCVFRCDATSSCLGAEFNPALIQSNCQLFAMSSSGSTTVSLPRLYFDKLG